MTDFLDFPVDLQTEKNKLLSNYFRKNYSEFHGIWNGSAKGILKTINNYIQDNNINKSELSFPHNLGSEIHLIPIDENILLKVIIVDEYYDNGEYSKYIMADFFIMNEKTSTDDVDLLIEFLNTLQT